MTGMECHQQAVEAYNEAYQRAEPELSYEILVGRAYSKYCTGDRRGSIADLTELSALEPDNEQLHTRRGITRGEIGDYQGAVADFERAGAIAGLESWPETSAG